MYEHNIVRDFGGYGQIIGVFRGVMLVPFCVLSIFSGA